MFPRVVMTPQGIFFAPAESEEDRLARFARVLRVEQAIAIPVRPDVVSAMSA